MDSFFSLFDPSDGNQSKTANKKRNKSEQDNVKKKTDTPTKGRRGRRRTVGKTETLPEESSFLCEPGLDGSLLGGGGSYIETHIAIRSRHDQTSIEPDKKPKRRNSGRKNRRKKYNRVSPSPAKDVLTNAWDEDSNTDLDRESERDRETTSWNNQSVKPKVCDGNIGKNVNNLKSEDSEDHEEPIYNVIDELEKVSIKDDMYLAGDFNMEDLDSDFFYNSDDMDESFDDTGSEDSDSTSSAHGSLPPEPRFGNVEYKLQLVRPAERRLQHLVTQLKWRLRSGGGTAIYVLGVRDCGALRGLRPRALRASVTTLRRMAATLHATIAHVSLRRVPGTAQRCVAEIYIRKLADTQQSVELRVAVMGANEAGKSTLVGVLTQGELDNGRGSARLNMFRHQHEVRSGRTSSLSHEILGFDLQGNVVNYGCSELMTAERIGERSAKLVSFLDLAGHTKYQRTTLHGLSGYCPHYAMMVISATAGISHITEEHLGLVLALELPFFVVITKTELAQPPAMSALMATLRDLLQPHGKKPVLISDENSARLCAAPQRSILDTIGTPSEGLAQEGDPVPAVPVFGVSCVAGAGLRALHRYLLALAPPAPPAAVDHDDDGSCEFQIDEIFHVGDSGGPVVGGLLAIGRLAEGDVLRLGPLETGEFTPVAVKSIYRNRVPHGSVRAGQSASLGLGPTTATLRPGMVLLRTPRTAQNRARPVFPAPCKRQHCNTAKQVADLLRTTQNSLENSKNRKNLRRKNKNLLQDLAKVEDSLKKQSEIEHTNIYKSESDSDDLMGYRKEKEDKKVLNIKESLHMKATQDGDSYGCEGDSDSKQECTCDETVPLDDPDDPRGCVYFQATVRVLRHATVMSAGFQCTVHVGNVRQTAVIQGILSRGGCLRAGEAASLVFRFLRCPEYLRPGRRLLLTAGLGTRAIGRVTQTFPYFP